MGETYTQKRTKKTRKLIFYNKDKQLTLKEIIEKIGKAECLSCGRDINQSISYRWKIPLCRKCRIEALEDLDEYKK